MLARFALDVVRDNATHLPQRAITAAISFDFRYILKRERGSAKGPLLRALLYQILENDPWALSGFFHSWGSNSSFPERPEDLNYRDYQRYLISALSVATHNASVFIFIDGLDECDPDVQDDLMACIEPFYSTPAFVKKVRICVSSRHIPTMQREHEKFRAKRIDLDMENTQDIANFCSAMLWSKMIDPEVIVESYGTKPWDNVHDSLQQLVNVITSRANGMFLWARLAVNSLSTSFSVQRASIHSTEQWEKAIQALPTDLDLLYEVLIEQIPSELSPTVKLVLSWCTFAARPLTIAELHAAIGYDLRRSDQPQYVEENLNRTSHIVDCCGSFIEVVSCPPSKTKRVQLIHRTTRDFLIGVGSRHVMPIGPSHTILAKSCIRSMASSAFNESGLHDALQSYSVVNWAYHAQICESLGISQEYLLDLFQWPSIDRISRWLARRRRFKPDQYGLRTSKRITLLHVASQYGLISTIQAMPLRASASIFWDQIDDVGRTPLHYACFHGHLNVAITLLKYGAHVNSTDLNNHTPLHVAAKNGHQAVVQLLLHQGANVNAADANRSSPLHCAARIGNIEVIKQLLQHGADPNDVDPHGHSILALATISGMEDAARFALSLENTKWPSTSVGIALVLAAALGCSALARSLLRSDRFVHHRTLFIERAFIAAIVSGYEEIVSNFLDDGCHPDVYDHQYGQSALSLAAAGGHERVVNVLLQHGANPNTQDIQTGKTPVMHAISHGFPTIVRLLVNQGGQIKLPKGPDTVSYDGWIYRVVSALTKQCPSGSSGSGDTKKSGEPSTKSVTGNSNRGRGSQRQNNSGRKRSHSETNPSEDEGNPENERKNRKRACTKVQSEYACPYQKVYPDQHRCPPYKVIYRLKEHIYRNHSSVFCPDCWKTFAEEDDVREHLRTDTCKRRERDNWSEGICSKQREDLKSRKEVSKISDEEHWGKVFKLLFPKYQGDIPDSAYHTTSNTVEEAVQQLCDDPCLRQRLQESVGKRNVEEVCNAFRSFAKNHTISKDRGVDLLTQTGSNNVLPLTEPNFNNLIGHRHENTIPQQILDNIPQRGMGNSMPYVPYLTHQPYDWHAHSDSGFGSHSTDPLSAPQDFSMYPFGGVGRNLAPASYLGNSSMGYNLNIPIQPNYEQSVMPLGHSMQYNANSGSQRERIHDTAAAQASPDDSLYSLADPVNDDDDDTQNWVDAQHGNYFGA